jgi:hypothetical protein
MATPAKPTTPSERTLAVEIPIVPQPSSNAMQATASNPKFPQFPGARRQQYFFAQPVPITFCPVNHVHQKGDASNFIRSENICVDLPADIKARIGRQVAAQKEFYSITYANEYING